MKNQTKVYPIKKVHHGTRLDRFLMGATQEMSRTYLQRLIRGGDVTVNDKVTHQPSHQLRDGDRVCLTLPVPRPLDTVAPENIPLDILHEDSHLIVLNKSSGMLVHPASGVNSGTLVNALLSHCTDLSGIGGVERPGIVHRLDKDTSGVLVVAKTDVVHHGLSTQFEAHSITRQYIAIVCGVPSEATGTIDAPIARSRRDRRRMTTVKTGGRRSVTHYEVLERVSAILACSTYIRDGSAPSDSRPPAAHWASGGWRCGLRGCAAGTKRCGDSGVETGTRAAETSSVTRASPRL